MLGETALLMAIGREEDCADVRFLWSCWALQSNMDGEQPAKLTSFLFHCLLRQLGLMLQRN